MKKLVRMRFVFLGILLIGLFAFAAMAVSPAQAALTAVGAAQEITVVPPDVNPTVVVVPNTGGDATTTSWLPVIIIIGVALVVLLAVALAGRGTRTDV